TTEETSSASGSNSAATAASSVLIPTARPYICSIVALFPTSATPCAIFLSEIGSHDVVDLHELHRRAVHLDECDQHTATRTVRFDDHVLILECAREIVDFECDMGHGLHEVRIRRVVPIPLPLDPERVVLMVAHGDLQMRHRNLAGEPLLRRDTDVVE